MKDLVIKELTKELNWREKIILKIFKRYSYKMYKKGIEKGVNAVL